MKVRVLILGAAIVILCLLTVTAQAIQLGAVFNADCDGFEFTVTGISWYPYTLTYTLEVTGFAAPVVGSFDIIPGADNTVNTYFESSWGEQICGAVTVTGTYVMSSDRSVEPYNYPIINGSVGPVSLDCLCGPCDCRGKVTQLMLQYQGGETGFVEVVQKKPETTVFAANVSPGEIFMVEGVDKKGTLGTEISIFINGVLNTKIHTSCSQPIGPGLVRGLFLVVDGYSREGGRLCPVEPVLEECGCEGKVSQLTLKYNGGTAATVSVVMKKPETEIFNGLVEAGGTFSFSGQDKKGTMGTEISVFVNGVLNTKIHTSCSQPIGPGLVSGDFLVVSGFSREGGALCPLTDAPCLTCRPALKKAAEMPAVITLQQNNPNPFNPVTTIQFTIPSGNAVDVRLDVYDIRGGLIRSLVSDTRNPGTYSVIWDATDNRGVKVSSGVYVYRLTSGDATISRKMLLVR